jgi:hypothetical protein
VHLVRIGLRVGLLLGRKVHVRLPLERPPTPPGVLYSLSMRTWAVIATVLSLLAVVGLALASSGLDDTSPGSRAGGLAGVMLLLIFAGATALVVFHGAVATTFAALKLNTWKWGAICGAHWLGLFVGFLVALSKAYG